MKILKTIIVVVTLLIGGVAFTGCEDGNASNNQQSGATTPEQLNPQVGEKPLDSKEKKAVLDSINVLVTQIEALTEKQNTYANDLKDATKEISDLKGSSNLFDLISWVIAAIALIVAIIALIKFNSIQRRADRHRQDIGKLESRIISLEQKANVVPVRNKSTNSGFSSSEYTTLASRIYKIERQLDKTSQGTVSEPQTIVPSNLTSDVRRTVNEQSGYFGLPTQMSLTEAYFKRLSDIRESDSRFTVEVRNDRAEFRPLEGTQYLNDLKSNDSIKMALDFQGCAPSEATQMKVILPGEAKKDGDRWIITKKATIALYR